MAFDWRHAAGLEIDIGAGQIPTRGYFERLDGPLWISAYGIHHNPRFYKHYWKIWQWRDTIPEEDLDEYRQRLGAYPWLSLVPELSFAEGISRMRSLMEANEVFMVVDERVKRGDSSAPWNVKAIKARRGRLAPAFDDDPDELFCGHK